MKCCFIFTTSNNLLFQYLQGDSNYNSLKVKQNKYAIIIALQDTSTVNINILRRWQIWRTQKKKCTSHNPHKGIAGTFEARSLPLPKYHDYLRWFSNNDAISICSSHNFKLEVNPQRINEHMRKKIGLDKIHILHVSFSYTYYNILPSDIFVHEHSYTVHR